MELIPKAVVVGVLAPTINATDQTRVTRDKLNRIWAEVTGTFPYAQLQLAADGSGGLFLGADGQVNIQPPLLQVQDATVMGAERSHDKAQSILKTVVRHLGVSDFLNLGVKHVFQSPAPSSDGRSDVLNRILSKTEADLGELRQGGDMWGGVKYVVNLQGAVYTLVIEPLMTDPKYLYIDLDVQWPGPADLEAVKSRAGEAETYITQAVNSYLDSVLRT